MFNSKKRKLNKYLPAIRMVNKAFHKKFDTFIEESAACFDNEEEFDDIIHEIYFDILECGIDKNFANKAFEIIENYTKEWKKKEIGRYTRRSIVDMQGKKISLLPYGDGLEIKGNTVIIEKPKGKEIIAFQSYTENYQIEETAFKISDELRNGLLNIFNLAESVRENYPWVENLGNIRTIAYENGDL